MPKKRGKCSVSGCGGQHYGHGYCLKHYAMWRKHGDALRDPQESRRRTKLGSNNPMWKGEQVSYHSLHEWVRTHSPRPLHCGCGNKKTELANKSGRYLRDLTDWEWLCRRCHMTADGRLNGMGLIGKGQRLRNGKDRRGLFSSGHTVSREEIEVAYGSPTDHAKRDSMLALIEQ